jgi:2-oxoisovalerate dehydrogenase E2 component (dihydrolipoyl transacylase)
MPTYKEFRLPDLGEGLTEGEILKWLVQPGDQVTLNQPIVEVETAKAAVEVPSPFAGVVAELHHAEGETVDVGNPLITFDVEPGAAGAPGGPRDDRAGEAAVDADDLAAARGSGAPAEDLVPDIPRPDGEGAVEPGLIGGPAPGGRTSVLVGYGPREGASRRRPRKGASAPAAEPPRPAEPDTRPPAPEPPPPAPPAAARVSAAAVGEGAAAAPAGAAALAKPPVRKLARDRGVDLHSLAGTGPGGTITRADVEGAAAGGPAEGAAPAAHAVPPAAVPAGSDERIAVRGVRRATAAAMVSSAFTAPHVTEFTACDVTAGLEWLGRLRELPEFAEVKVTPLLLAARALIIAVNRHPMINSTWDEAAGEIVVHHYVNLGIAAATPRGLIVPNVKSADRLVLPELARALTDLARTARDGRTPPADMLGGTITITNVGVFGVDTGTPILNPGEAAILCLGTIRPTPWVHEGAIVVRQVTQLGLSFDHRVVDGQLGSEVLSDVARMMADPSLMLAWA